TRTAICNGKLFDAEIGYRDPECGNVNDCAVDGVLRRHSVFDASAVLDVEFGMQGAQRTGNDTRWLVRRATCKRRERGDAASEETRVSLRR
ncbi:MAG: hypothetical protein JRE82_13080, partial [Deltaproteobacteria bacterium]|nr:hypothetical protein [Deltaproteobacteria bacterium]